MKTTYNAILATFLLLLAVPSYSATVKTFKLPQPSPMRLYTPKPVKVLMPIRTVPIQKWPVIKPIHLPEVRYR